MKECPIIFSGPMVRAILENRKTMTRRPVKPIRNCFRDDTLPSESRDYTTCPYGKPGDRLWVRESYLCHNQRDEVWYRADGGPPADDWDCRWSPSIFMPRKYSRIILEVINIKVERLQEITNDDMMAEGIEWQGNSFLTIGIFKDIWDSIYGPDSWNQNPWVWVIKFKRLK